MATSSAGTNLPDALAKLRIQRAEPRMNRSWLNGLLRIALLSTAVLGIAVTGVVLAYRNGWISAGENWITIPEIMQSRIEGRVATVTVESGSGSGTVN